MGPSRINSSGVESGGSTKSEEANDNGSNVDQTLQQEPSEENTLSQTWVSDLLNIVVVNILNASLKLLLGIDTDDWAFDPE